MLELMQFLKKLRLRWLERLVYTRVDTKFCVALEEMSPLIPACISRDAVLNTEADKNSVYLESSAKPKGINSLIINQ